MIYRLENRVIFRRSRSSSNDHGESRPEIAIAGPLLTARYAITEKLAYVAFRHFFCWYVRCLFTFNGIESVIAFGSRTSSGLHPHTLQEKYP